MIIIAGLGNPKKEYDNTRHNIGFALVDALAEKYHISVMDVKHRALIGESPSAQTSYLYEFKRGEYSGACGLL